MPEDTGTTAGAPAMAIAALGFEISEKAMIPLADGQAVSRGWMPGLGSRPHAVTWHWTVTWDLALCRRVLGGANAERKGIASAHYGVGRSFAEGVDRYVSLENRSWHAGKSQTLRWDGRAAAGPDDKGSRTSIGVETVNIGAAVDGVKAGPDWIRTATPDGRPIRVQPWTGEQVQMMIAVGKEIVLRWPGIGVRDHHGHHDICPGYKIDVCGFPFARVLRGIYNDPTIPDVWSPLETVQQRQRALMAMGFDLGAAGADGVWGKRSAAALKAFQQQHGMVVNGYWSTFVCWKLHDALAAQGESLVEVTEG